MESEGRERAHGLVLVRRMRMEGEVRPLAPAPTVPELDSEEKPRILGSTFGEEILRRSSFSSTDSSRPVRE